MRTNTNQGPKNIKKKIEKQEQRERQKQRSAKRRLQSHAKWTYLTVQ
jgi:hypothetical protein